MIMIIEMMMMMNTMMYDDDDDDDDDSDDDDRDDYRTFIGMSSMEIKWLAMITYLFIVCLFFLA